jgi:hypothetical protein
MAAISDAFTIGVILLLIFGAISFYLYTRIQQTEKRLNLCENILLDLKVSTEQGMHISSLDFMTSAETAPTELYESAIEAAYNSEEVSAMDDITVEKVENLPEDTFEQNEIEEDIDISLYDSLNVKELKNLAKNNHISGASSMSRTQIIDALSKAKIIPSITNESATNAVPFGENGAVSFD